MTDVPDWNAVVSSGSRLAASGTVPSGGQTPVTVALAITDQSLVLFYYTATSTKPAIFVGGDTSFLVYGSPTFGVDNGLSVAAVPVSGLVDPTVTLTFSNTGEGDTWWCVASSDDHWADSDSGYLAPPTIAPYTSAATDVISCGQGHTTLLAAPAAGTVHLINAMWAELADAATAAGHIQISGNPSGHPYGVYQATASGTTPTRVPYYGAAPLYVTEALEMVNSSGVDAFGNIVYSVVTAR